MFSHVLGNEYSLVITWFDRIDLLGTVIDRSASGSDD